MAYPLRLDDLVPRVERFPDEQDITPENPFPARRAPARCTYVTRSCKLRGILQDDFKYLVDDFRRVAEDFQVLRRDALLLANLHIRRLCELRVDNGNVINGDIVPDLLTLAFWRHCLELVASPYPGTSRFTRFHAEEWHQQLVVTFNNHYNPCRRYDNTMQIDRYDIPSYTSLVQYIVADTFTTSAITNAKQHLCGNVLIYMKRSWEALFLHVHPNQLPRKPSALATMATHAIKHHLEFDNAFDWLQNLPENVVNQAEQFYNLILPRYIQIVPPAMNLEDLEDEALDRITVMRIMDLSFIMLRQAETHPLAKKWSILPLAKHQIGFVEYDTEGLFKFFKLLYGQTGSHNLIPRPMMSIIGQMHNRTAYMMHMDDYGNQEQLWNQLFQLNKIAPFDNRRSFSRTIDENRAIKPFGFAFAMQTDGHSARFRFKIRRVEQYPSTKKEFWMLTPGGNMSGSYLGRGIYHTNKNPTHLNDGILANARVVGIDPGIRDLFTAVSTSNGEQLSRDNRKVDGTITTISNREYQERSGFQDSLRTELKAREHSGIQTSYNELTMNPPTVSSVQSFQQHIRAIARVHDDIHGFNIRYRHRERRERNLARRQSTLDTLAISISRSVPRGKLPRKHASKRERRRIRRSARRSAQLQQYEDLLKEQLNAQHQQTLQQMQENGQQLNQQLHQQQAMLDALAYQQRVIQNRRHDAIQQGNQLLAQMEQNHLQALWVAYQDELVATNQQHLEQRVQLRQEHENQRQIMQAEQLQQQQQFIQQQFIQQQQQPPPTIISYGDADLRGTMRGHAPLPTKTFRQYLAKYCLVMCVDEFNTSQICSQCDNRLVNIVENYYRCNHRTKVFNITFRNHHRRIRYCLNDAGERMNRTSECQQALAADPIPKQIWPLKVCTNCISVHPRAGSNRPLIVNRDINAAANMHRILTQYIENGERPLALSRANT